MRHTFYDILKKLGDKNDLSFDEGASAFRMILDEKIPLAQTVLFLESLRDKGETVDEIMSAVTVLHEKAITVPCQSKNLLDTCGTGGDSKNTFNISTAVAFVVAGCGVKVAKHGNKAVSSQSGSADVLSELGVNCQLSPRQSAKLIDTLGIAFLWAPLYHPSLKAVTQARLQIKTRTIFNMLGPLLNPAKAQFQLMGVFSQDAAKKMSEVALKLGIKRFAVVCGDDGLDEVSMTGPSQIIWGVDGKWSVEHFDPQSVGYAHCQPQDLVGGTAKENAKRLSQTLRGHSEPVDHCVHLNSAVALKVAGLGDNMKDTLLMAQESISSGKAYQKLDALVKMSNDPDL